MRGQGWGRQAGRIAALALATIALVGATPVARLDVGLDNLRSTKGLVRICVTADPGNFPACDDGALALKRNVPATAASTEFDALPVGTYAVAVIHDENGNHQLDTVAGIPREGFGFSRNPPVRFGPPRFAAARFALAGEAERQQVRMRYIF